ncbi:hypothetical protein BXT86_00305 [candidate division WOR-3 bacterium 4484_100]|uniref:Type II secretion system protein GspC N-terminal domain-containing protein n=1 Tax=candidate division WOR-3 bacterium 4484_100 TaxID=1936077 RepID=A0A1V4QHZ1_UNCW3|nr:MAG: hypothetical protein BXT86_00305 [candidate division WOR-3 bacterium 4484_100]
MVLHLVVGNFLLGLLLFNQTPSAPSATDTLFPVEKWHYTAKGRRDPFVPLVGTELSQGGKTSHLSVENLTLIGILWGDKGYYALVKDGLNNGYILRRGDRVAGGKVAEINRRAIIFQIVHAGVVTKYELPLKEKERR